MAAQMKYALVGLACAVLSACGGGGGSSTGSSGSSGQSGPIAVVQSNSALAAGNGGSLQAALGYQVTLNGQGSTDASSTITSYAWVITSKPANSNLSLTASTAASTSFKPDVTGNYVLTLTVTDAQGMSAAESVTVAVNNAVPVISVTNSVVFSAPSSVLPAQNIATGDIVTLDATGTTDPRGVPVNLTWQLLQEPANSTSGLIVAGSTAHFSPDVVGTYAVQVRATNLNGYYSQVTYTYNAVNVAPSTIVAAGISPAAGNGTITAATNYAVVLNAASSLVPAGDSASMFWSLDSKPAGSTTAQLSTTSGSYTGFVPDVAGNYQVTLVVNDTTTGLHNAYTTVVQAAQAPTAVVSGSATPVALASAPSFVSSAGVPVTLRGSGSYDLAGGSLSYLWSLVSRPAGSTASIATPTAQNISFTPDINGAYVLTLKVSDAAGNASSQSVTLNVGNYPPVAVVSQTQLATLLGGTVTDSAAGSYDQDGNPLSYSWSIDARPAGSTATIATPNTAAFSFKPDVAGIYTAAVTVTDGGISSIATVTITASALTPGTVPLSYLPLMEKYSKSLGKAVIVSSNPNALHIVDPMASTDVSVALPTGVKALGLSPNGKLAAVLHEGIVSLVDLTSGTLVHSATTGGSQTDVFINNAGLIYLVGQTGGQWVTPSITSQVGSTGVAGPNYFDNGSVYGTTLGIYSDVNNKIFTLSEGLSPSQIYAFTLDPGTGAFTGAIGSPYWGTYGMGVPFWLSGDQSLLFTAAGTYFKTADLTYQGNFGLGNVLSMSHSATAQEAVLLLGVSNSYSTTTYPSVLKRFTGSLLIASTDIALPLIGGQQTYGMAVFHAADDTHVLVVQTGTSTAGGSGAQYYLLDR